MRASQYAGVCAGGERKRGVCADCAVDERVSKRFYSSAVRGRMETQSAGSFQLRERERERERDAKGTNE